MRPLRLTMQGFRSHREETTIDFRGRSLIGVVGPTGSGKSSVLDAISFALYGRTPVEGRAIKKLINHRCQDARVALWFRVGDDTFRVVRTLGEKGPSMQVLERWDEVDGNKIATLADKQDEIMEHVQALLGLDFGGFTKSALLAQDRFSELLRAAPAEAARLLTRLFGFEVVNRMKEITEVRLATVKAELAAATQAAQVQLALRNEMAQATRAREEAETGMARREALVAEVARIDEQIEELSGRQAVGVATRDSLGLLLERLPAGDERRRTFSDVTEHSERLAAAEAAREAAAVARDLATAAVDEAMAVGLEGAVSRLEAAIEAAEPARRSVEEAARGVEDHRQGLLRVEAEMESLRLELVQAEETAQVARATATARVDELRVIETAHAAHGLAEGLRPGDECPVCRRTVIDLPGLDPPAGLDSARRLATEASTAAARADSAVAALDKRLAAVRATVEAGTKAIEEAERGLAAARERDAAARAVVEGAVAGVGGGSADPPSVLGAARLRWTSLVEARDKAVADLVEADRILTGLATSDLPGLLARTIESCRPAAEAVGVEIEADVDATRLASLIDEAEAKIWSRLTEIDRELSSLESRKAELLEQRSARLVADGLRPDEDLAASLATSKEQLAALRAVEDVLAGQAMAGANALAAAAANRQVAQRLAHLNTDLARGKFLQFLLGERRRELAAAGTEWFREMSAGRYGFELVDNSFKIREITAAGSVRDADTLSGGETFLASLSLALGLAALVSMDGGALDSFFIDEGFGALDADSLDLAMAGIERLVSKDGDRLVMVVSHVPELRERMEDLIVLEKDPITNETIVIRA